MISRETINQVREKTDIVQLIESKGIALQRSGSSYKGLCPVHSERSPSFYVRSDSQTYHCFGCGVHGDAINFIMEVDGYNFSGAVEYLADLVDIVVENTEGEDPDYLRKKEYIKCVGDASQFYRRMFAVLPEDHPAKKNLDGRNYLHVEGRETWLEDFGMGFAPDSYDMLSKYLTKKGYSQEQIIDAGLAFVSDKTNKLIDRFRNRLMWEIRDIQGRPIGFSGRRLNENDNPKYLNTSQTVLYNKSKVLYGLDLAKKKIVDEKTCFVVEGAADVMALAAVGAVNTVASCGTAFGSDHAAIIRRMIDDFDSQKNGRFVFVFDGDAAGVKAALRVFDITPSIRDRAYVVVLDEGDPVDYRVNHGDEALYDLLMNNQVPITEFMIQNAKNNHDFSTAEGRQNFAREALNIISGINEIAIYESYKRKIAFLSGIPLELMSGNLVSNHSKKTPTKITSEPEYQYDPWSEELPPDTGYDQAPPVDYYADEPEVSPTPEPKKRQLTVAETNEKTLIATLLQYPEEAFPVLRDRPDVIDLFTNESFQVTLYDAMMLIGYDFEQKQKPKLRTSDFSDENGVIEMFHLPLSVTPDRVASSVKRIILTLEKLSKKKHNELLKAKLSSEIVSDNSEDLDVLARMLQNRRK